MRDIVSINPNMSVEEIKKSRARAKPSEIVEAVNLLFAGFSSREKSKEEIEVITKAYLIALEDKPAQSIAIAVKEFIQGNVSGINKSFVPSAPELAAEAERQFWLSLPTPERKPMPGRF